MTADGSPARTSSGPERQGSWRSVAARLGVDVRAGEGAPAALLFLYFFLIITFQYASKAVRQAEYIDQLGAAMLPLVYFLVAVCSLPLLVLYSRFVDRMPRHHLIAATSLIVAASLVTFWWLFQFPGEWVPVVFYVWISIVYVLNVSQFWSYANHVFDPRQAKRLFGFIGTGGLLGGIAGGQVARLATRLIGTHFSLLAAAAFLIAAGGLIYVIQRARPRDDGRTAGTAGLAKLEAAKGGFGIIRRSRHLQLVAGIMLLTVIVAQIVDVQFNAAVQAATTTLDERTAYFGNFLSVMGIVAVVFQILFTSRIHRSLGIGTAMRFLPVSMGLGTAGILGAGAAFPGLVLPSAYSLKVAENGLRYSLDQATRELLFLPVPSAARIKAKAYIDVFVQRSGKGLAALLLLPVLFHVMTPVQAGWISLTLIVAWLGATVAMRRRYVRSFRDGLNTAAVDAASPIDLSDATSLEMLIQALDSTDARQVLHSLELLEANDKGHLVPRLMLSHGDAAVRARTLRVFANTGRHDAAPMVERLLGDDNLEVRVEAVRALASLQGSDAATIMLPRLEDPDVRIRAAAISAVAARGGDGVSRAEAALTELTSDANAEARAEAARVLGEIPDPAFENQLIQLLYDSDPRVTRQALRAARQRIERDGFNPIYGPILISAMRHRRVKHEARSAIVACGPGIIPALVHFLNDPKENIWVRRAIPKTVARIGTPAAVAALADGLDTEDAFLRRKAVEALGVLHATDMALTPSPEVLGRRVSKEIGNYLRHLADLYAVGGRDGIRFQGPVVVWDERPPTFLHHLLADRMRGQVDNVFGLLSLLYDPADMRAAHSGLVGTSAARRTHALEYLDNTLKGSVRTAVFAAIGDLPHGTRLQRARDVYGIDVESRERTLRRLMSEEGLTDAESAWLAAAAVHAAYATRAEHLYPYLRNLADQATDPLVRETARWVATRLDRQERR